MPNVMAPEPNIGGAICESSIIPFHVARCKFWLTPTAEVPCSNVANIGERKTWDTKWILHLTKFCQGARAPESTYIVYQPRRRPNVVQSLVGFRWATLLQQGSQDVKPVEISSISAASRPKFTILWGRVEEILLFNKLFSDCRYVP